MTAAEFTRLVVEVCGLALPPGITTERLAAFAAVESGRTSLVLNVNGPGGGARRFATEAAAIAAARALDAEGRDYDAGILQINRRNWARLGLTAETAFRPCPNIAAGLRILADADRRAACIWNTGRGDCRSPSGTNDYPERIAAAAARPVRAGQVATAAAAPPEPTSSWDVWATPPPAGDPEAPPAASPPNASRLVVELRKGD